MLVAHSRSIRFLRDRVFPALVWLAVVVSTPLSGLAQKAQPVFEADLASYGYRFQYTKNDHFQNFTDVAFLSDDLVLVSVKELSLDELHPQLLPSGTVMYENPMGASTAPTSLSTLLLFSLAQKKLVGSQKLPVRKTNGAVQAVANGKFLMLSSHGLHLCTADLTELRCGPPRPTDGPVYVSPRGTKAVIGGFQFTEQQLLDVGSLTVLEAFRPRAPKIIPGDEGWLEEDREVVVRIPGQKDLALDLASSHTFPQTRFLDQDKVVGVKMLSIGKGKATVVKVDGTVLYQIDVEEAWRGHASFVGCTSGLRFSIWELYYTRLNRTLNFFDIGDHRAYNRERVRVFETATGKQILELDWDPREYRGEDILPALSASGRRLAVVKKGRLQVYEVP